MPGIKIPFLADVRDFLRGTKNVEESLDDVADALDDVGREAQRSRADDAIDDIGDAADDAERKVRDLGDRSEDAFDDVGDGAKDAAKDIDRHIDDAQKDVDNATEKMEKSFKDAFDKAKTESKQAGDDVTRNTRRGFDKGTEAVGEFKQEATQNFSEVASSFSGDMDGAVDLVQGTLGGLANSIPGGVGLALGGLGAAAGVFYSMWNENAEKTEERISQMYQDMAESGNDYLSSEFINQGVRDILDDTADSVISYADAQRIAAESGVELSTVLRAYAGDAESASTVQRALNDKLAEEQAAQEGSISAWSDRGQAVTQSQDQLKDYIGTLDGVTNATDSAGDRARAYRDAQVTSAEATRDYTEALAEMDDAAKDANDQIAENNDTIADQRQRTIENNAVLSDLAGNYLDVQDSAREANVSTDELNRLQHTQYQRFMDTARSAGMLTSEARDLAERLGLIPEDVRTDINVTDNGTTREVQREIDGIDGGTVTMRTAVSAWQLQQEVDAAARRIRKPIITVGFRAGQRVV